MALWVLLWVPMASVRRVPRSAYWWICYRGPDGRRRQVSSRKTDREEALALANSRERAARAARDGRWGEGHAGRFLNEVRAILGTNGAAPIVAAEWIRQWLESVKPRLRPRTQRRYSDALAAFLAHLGPRAHAMLDDIRASDVCAWRDAMLAAGKSISTVNTDLAVVNAAFSEAMHPRRLILDNPCAGARLKVRKGMVQVRQPFTWGQFEAMLAAAQGEWRVFLAVLGLTGARQQEAAKLRWDQVDFDRRVIQLVRGKSRDAVHVVPMGRDLERVLRQAHGQASSLAVCPGIAAAAGRALSNTFRRRILRAIGIDQAYGSRPGCGRTVAPYSLHSLRHSVATWLDDGGCSDVVRMAILGHDDPKVALRYAHADIARGRAALDALPRLVAIG